MHPRRHSRREAEEGRATTSDRLSAAPRTRPCNLAAASLFRRYERLQAAPRVHACKNTAMHASCTVGESALEAEGSTGEPAAMGAPREVAHAGSRSWIGISISMPRAES
jgi:hypothetical protein